MWSNLDEVEPFVLGEPQGFASGHHSQLLPVLDDPNRRDSDVVIDSIELLIPRVGSAELLHLFSLWLDRAGAYPVFALRV